MTRRAVSIAVAALFAVALFGTLGVQMGFGAVQQTPSPSESPSPSADRPVATVTTQDKTAEFDAWTWAPPQDDSPQVSAAEASDVAWDEGLPGSYRSETDRLASVTDSGSDLKSTPAWVIEYTGMCVPRFGPAPPPGSESSPGPTEACDATWYVVVRADTGEFVAATSGSG